MSLTDEQSQRQLLAPVHPNFPNRLWKAFNPDTNECFQWPRLSLADPETMTAIFPARAAKVERERRERLDRRFVIMGEEMIVRLTRPEEIISGNMKISSLTSNEKSTVSQTSSFANFPTEIFLLILEQLEDVDVLCLTLTCTYFFEAGRRRLKDVFYPPNLGVWAGNNVQFAEYNPSFDRNAFDPSNVDLYFDWKEEDAVDWLAKLESARELEPDPILLRDLSSRVDHIEILRDITADSRYPGQIRGFVNNILSSLTKEPLNHWQIQFLFGSDEVYVARNLDRKEYMNLPLSEYGKIPDSENLEGWVALLRRFIERRAYYYQSSPSIQVKNSRWVNGGIDIVKKSTMLKEEGWLEYKDSVYRVSMP